MIRDILSASPAERRFLGGDRKRGATLWVIAIMSFSMLIVAAAGLALSNAAGVVTQSVDRRHSVQVPGGSADLGALLGAVRSSRGVRSAEAVTEREMRATLERWLGPAANSRDLPVPALIHFDLEPGSDVRAVEQSVSAIAPAATIVSHGENLAPLLRSLRTLQWLALGLVLLLAAAAGSAVVLAARGALDTHRFTIEVMHGIGATDEQVTRLFQRKIFLEALGGSIAGGAAGALVLLMIGAGASFAGDMTGGVRLDAIDVLILLLLPLALTVLATVVARTAVLRALREAL